MVAPFLPDEEKLAAVREGLPAVGAGIYLDTPMAGPLPAETARAMADVESWELGTGRAGRDRRGEVVGRIDEARAAAATLISADLDEVALAHGLDEAMARAIRTIDWRPDDRAVVVADPGGVRLSGWLPKGVDEVRVEPSPSDVILGEVERAVARGARLVACPLVSAATGERLPVEDITAVARASGAVSLVDVTQAAGTSRVDRRELGADFLVARSESWLLGPEGLAVMAAQGDLLERAGLGLPGEGPRGGGGEDGPLGFHLPSVVGLGRSCGWLSMYVGLAWIEARARQLAGHAVTALAAIPGVEVLTPARAGCLVVFRIAGWSADAALDELGARVFLLASPVRSLDAIRIGVGFFNTEAEIDRLVDAVGLLATHRPGTLPPRRTLAILGEAQ